MSRLIIALMCVLALALTACEQQKVAETPQSEKTTTSEQAAPGTEQQTAMQDQQTTTQGQEAQPAVGEQDQTAMQEPATSDQQDQQQLAMGERQDQAQSESSAQPQASDTEQQGVAATEESQSQEHLGQSPEFGNAPETIILEAKNGNITFPHKEHAGMMDCKTCHGDSGPGPIEGFAKDQAHKLCRGCHQDKGAGPTKCSECHKKS